MQTESTGPVRMVRWLGALIFLAAPFALASGCTAGDVEEEPVATTEQAATSCVCLDRDLCGLDTCSSTKGEGLCVLRCTLPAAACYVQSDGTHCTTSGDLSGTCHSGICVSSTCDGCVNTKGLCVVGTSVTACGSDGAACENCNDNNQCTTDTCASIAKTGIRACRHTAVEAGTPCSSGVCVGTTCCTGCVTESGACSAGTSPGACGKGGDECQVCPDTDGNLCTVATCTASGECGIGTLAEGTFCDNASVCDGREKCDASGECVTVPDTALDCDDGEFCTSDTCDPVDGCVHDATAMNDQECPGNGCTTNNKCLNGDCAGEGTLCEDRGPCVASSCDSGSCSYDSTALNGKSCTSNPCLIGQTCASGECTGGEPKCDDGNLCTADSCEDGECTNTDRACAPLDECHDAGVCDPITGQCSNPPQVDGTPCTGGECVTGSCEPVGAAGAGGAQGTGGTSGAGGIAQGGDTGSAQAGSGTAEAGTPSSEGGSSSTAGGSVAEAGSGQVSAAGADNAGGRPTTGDDDDDTSAAGSAIGGRRSTSDDDDDDTAAAGADNAGRGSTSDDDDDVAGSAGQGPVKLFKRSPGGCSCRVSTDQRSTGWLALAFGLAAFGRRRRHRRVP
jgi:MYXO-CTERM domain-containing protein